MRTWLPWGAVAGVVGLVGIAAAAPGGADGGCPFCAGAPFAPVNRIDALLAEGLARKGLRPAPRCSDAVFLRRVSLDLTGTLPTPAEVRRFLASDRPDKRAQAVDELMGREAFADYWTLKWCDILRVKAEYPINLWPNGVQAYARWIRDAVATNMPYDAFARELLTANGSNFRAPPVNFYRAVRDQQPATLAAAAALTFMGARIETWPTHRQDELAAFFSRVAFKGTAEWKESIVYPDPAKTDPLAVVFPDGQAATLAGDDDPRAAFAAWLVKPGNRWFARNLANRAWAWFFGAGLIDPPDDIRPDNPPVHPELLAWLEQELVAGGYDPRRLFRLIVESGAYQQCSVPLQPGPDATRAFARYPPRQLDAEVLLDALCGISGDGESYSSLIPEPFTFIPPGTRGIALVDGSITSPFLKMFGRPARDTGLEAERSRAPTREQRLHMLNSSHIQEKIGKAGAGAERGAGPADAVEGLYLTALSRFPTPAERKVAEQHLSANRDRQGRQDLLWALVNSKEFMYRH